MDALFNGKVINALIKLSFLHPESKPTVLTTVFSAPLVVKGWTGLPLIELVAWVILSLVAKHRRPDWSRRKQVYAGALTAVCALTLEWLHDLAHAAAAHWIGKPVNAIRNFWGTPLLVYYDVNDQTVSPHQHLERALAGPIFSALMVPVTWLAGRLSRPKTLLGYTARFAFGVNAFITALTLSPIPFLDGGAILKWSLVKKGRSLVEADQVVKDINRYVGSGLAAASGIAIKKHRSWLGALLAVFAASSLAVGFGLLGERN